MTMRFRRVMLPFAFVTLLTAAPAFAQHQGGIGVGAEFGWIHNNFTNAANNPFTAGNGTMFGLWVGGNRNGNVGFVGEFLYADKKASDANGNQVTFHALEIPAVFHINFGSGDRNKAGGYIVLGPAFTINLQKTISQGLAGSNFSSADIGFMAGGGIEIFRIGFEVRGNWGLKSVSNNNGGNFVNAKSKAVEVVAKFRFN